MPLPAIRHDAAPRRRWKPMPQPRALERAYYATLLAVVERTFAALRKKLAPYLPEGEAKRQDAEGDEEAPDNGALVTFTIEEVEVEFVRAFPTASVRAAAERTAREVDTAHLKAMRRQFSETLGINILQEAPRLRPTVEEFTKRNVALIKSIPQEAIDGLRKALVEKGLEKGIRPEALAKTLQERYGIAQRRAQLIATDQVGKMMANLTEERHRDLGITSYRWRTVRDNRVRRRHVKREGVLFSYDDPPTEGPDDGHPGTPIRCRCWSEPEIPEPALEKLESESKAASKMKPQASRPTTVFPAPPAKKKPTASRKAPAKKTPTKKAPTKKVTAKSTPAKALPAKRNNPPPATAMSLPRGPVRGVDAEAVMQVFPEVNVVGELLRVDEFSHPTVRSEVADLANLPPDLLRLLPKVANDIHIAPAPVTELGRSGSTAKMKNVRPRGFEEGSTMDQAAGLFVSEFKEVLVSARFNTAHTSIVLHEIGHAFDGSHFKKRTSTTAEFESAWDAFRAGPYAESRNPYYNQQYPAGPGETFAESFAVYFRFGASEATRRFGPEVVKVLESKYGPTVFKPRENQ